jgi:hypothetical protein
MRIIGRSSVPRVPEAPRHAEVDQENATALEPDNQILAAAIDGDDSLALELGGDLTRVERPNETRVVDHDALEHAADEHGLQARPDGLDLG